MMSYVSSFNLSDGLRRFWFHDLHQSPEKPDRCEGGEGPQEAGKVVNAMH